MMRGLNNYPAESARSARSLQDANPSAETVGRRVQARPSVSLIGFLRAFQMIPSTM